MDASMAATEKVEKECTGSPNFISTSSLKGYESPKIWIKTMEAVDEATLCLDRYSGNEGVYKIGFHDLSMNSRLFFLTITGI
ncbi:MAG: hypothetical protein ACK5ZX_05580 [Bacteroidota bacterium]